MNFNAGSGRVARSPVARKQRHVRNVPVIRGIGARDPVWNNSALKRRPRIDRAWPAAGCHDIVQRCRRSYARGQVPGSRICRTRIIPRYFVDVAQRGFLARSIRRGEKSQLIRGRRKIVEVRSAHRHIERRRSNSVDEDSTGCRRIIVEIVATRRTVVSSGHRHRDSLRRRLLPQLIQKLIRRRIHSRLARPKAQAHHIVRIVINHVFRAQKQRVGSQRPFREDVVNRRLLCHRARPLHI